MAAVCGKNIAIRSGQYFGYNRYSPYLVQIEPARKGCVNQIVVFTLFLELNDPNLRFRTCPLYYYLEVETFTCCINILPWWLIEHTVPDAASALSTSPPMRGRESNPPIRDKQEIIEACWAVKFSPSPLIFFFFNSDI